MNHRCSDHYKKLLWAFAAVCTAAALSVSALADDKREELADQREDASSALAQQEAELEEKEDLLDQAVRQGQVMKDQKEEITSQIYQLSEEMALLEDQLERARQAVNQKQAEYDGEWEQYKEIIGGMQLLHDRGELAYLAQAHSLYQLLTFSDSLQQISQSQDQALEELKKQKEELTQRQESLEELEDQLEAQKQEMDGKVQALSGQIQKQDAAISAAQAEKEAQQVQVEAAQAAFEEADAQYEAYVRQQIAQGAQDNTLYCGLDFGCPLDSYARISCRFGEPDGWSGKPHGGTDFAANAGSTIRAAAEGVVQAAGGSETYSYGYYVILYHGKDDAGRTIATLYAHMNEAPPVSVGQAVAKGDAIGRVGNTGNSKGYHLHLELRIDGNKTDPMVYIPG